MKELSETGEDEKPVLFDFFAEWCGPCQTMDPVLNALKQQKQGRIEIIRIDIDQNPGAAKRFNIMSVPTLVLYWKGKEYWRRAGLVTRSEIEEQIRKRIPAVD